MTNRVYAMDVDALDDEHLAQAAHACLSAVRRARADRFASSRDRNLSLGAGLLLDFALRSLGLREKDMRYGEGKHHKPYFLNEPEIHFNLSHSGNMALCALSDAEVGCDIELVADIQELGVASGYLSACEYDDILARPSEAERAALFFRYWSLKESYMKFTGLGMSLPPDSLAVRMDAEQTAVVRNGIAESVCFTEYRTIPGYACAVCSTSDFSGIPLVRVAVAQAL